MLQLWKIPFTVAALIAATAVMPARTATAKPANEVLDAYVEATGGREALDAERTVYMRGRVRSMGMTGTFEQWVQHPDRFLQRLTLGPVRMRTGYDGRVGWRTDLDSKHVTLLDGKDLEALRADAWFENGQWMDAERQGGKAELGTLSYRGSVICRAVEIRPPVGPGRHMWFDTRTHLLDRMERRRDQYAWTAWIGEWRDHRGRKRWMLESSHAPERRDELNPDEARFEERMTVDSVAVNVPLDSAFFSPPSALAAPVKWIRPATTATAQPATGSAKTTRAASKPEVWPRVVELPFRYGTRHIWVSASINGAKPADFLLDTGCSITAIDRDFAESAGLIEQGTLAVQGVSGTGQGSFANVKSIELLNRHGNGVAVRDLKVGIIDLGEGMEAVMWRRAAGLIGYDVLRHFVVTIDYDRRTVTLRDPSAFTAPDGVAPIEMRLHGGIPLVTAALGDSCRGDFILDTGNSFGLDVHGTMVRRCAVVESVARRRQVEIYSGGIGGASVNWLTRMDRLSLGGHVLEQPIAGISLGSRGLIGSREVSGNIGNGVLERFVCTYDYPGRRIFLAPGGRFAERDGYSRLGSFLVRYQGRVFPGHIVSGSPAQAAGLTLFDRVLSIDGRPAVSFTPEELDHMFEDGKPGTTHTFLVERLGTQKTLTITLADIL